MSSIWAKGCILMTVCMCVLSDLTRLPLLGVERKSWYIMDGVVRGVNDRVLGKGLELLVRMAAGLR